MVSWLEKALWVCCRPCKHYNLIATTREQEEEKEEEEEEGDELLWFKDLEQHSMGDLSMAVMQANPLLEDRGCAEISPSATFVGIYDGHGGHEAAQFVCDRLYLHLQEVAREQGGMSEEVLKKAFNTTEEEFMNAVSISWRTEPKLITVGSCCLVGVIHGEFLYAANLGDSRAVMGSFARGSPNISAVQLTSEHNVSVEEVRQELRAMHPDDAHVVELKHGVWRVKGIIQISRSIGDAYLKRPDLEKEIVYSRFKLSEPLKRPILRADPSVIVHRINPQDKFLIFASDGLWEQLSNQRAVEIVYNNPREGIARRLIRAALREAAKKREIRYADLRTIGKRIRRRFHDDITVVVVFLDYEMVGQNQNISPLSLKSELDTATSDLMGGGWQYS